MPVQKQGSQKGKKYSEVDVLHREKKRQQPRYQKCLSWIKSNFEGKFEDLCNLTTDSILSQESLVSENRKLREELDTMKWMAQLFLDDGDASAKLALAEWLFSEGFKEQSVVLFLAGEAASKRKFAMNGARKRLSRYAPIRQFAIDEFSKKKWSSVSQAATSLWPLINEEAEKIGQPMKATGGPETVYRWLREHVNSQRQQANT